MSTQSDDLERLRIEERLRDIGDELDQMCAELIVLRRSDLADRLNNAYIIVRGVRLTCERARHAHEEHTS